MIEEQASSRGVGGNVDGEILEVGDDELKQAGGVDESEGAIGKGAGGHHIGRIRGLG